MMAVTVSASSAHGHKSDYRTDTVDRSTSGLNLGSGADGKIDGNAVELVYPVNR